MTRGRLLDRIRVVLAGRAAEEVALGQPSTYGTSDLRVGLGALGGGQAVVWRSGWSCAGKFYGAFPKGKAQGFRPGPDHVGPTPAPCARRMRRAWRCAWWPTTA